MHPNLMTTSPLSVRESLRGKHLLLLGSTGFLGKIFLSTLLYHVPEIGSVRLLIRRDPQGRSAAERWAALLRDPVHEPWQRRHGPALVERVQVIEGDITQPQLGIAADMLPDLVARTDVILNSSGQVDFNPPLAEALGTNVDGSMHCARLTAQCAHAQLIHISTCFVVGNRSGDFSEDTRLVDWIPHPQATHGAPFSHREEIALCRHMLAHRDASAAATWAAERATTLGWPNLYTYTKALAEQFVASHLSTRATIVRPAIIESALRYPEPGWNEGINTSAPLTFLGMMGQICFPCGPGVVLDVVPVDMVAQALCLITAAVLHERAAPLYQLGSSDTNPLTMRDTIELTGLYKHRYRRLQDAATSRGERWRQRIEVVPVRWSTFERYSAPTVRRLAENTDNLLSVLGNFVPRLRNALQPLQRSAQGLARLGKGAERLFRLYRPFIYDHCYRFRCDHIRTLAAQLVPAERADFVWTPQDLDWHHYWLEVHMPGLERHVFPHLEARTRRLRTEPPRPATELTPLRPSAPAPTSRGWRVPLAIQRPIRALLGAAQRLIYARGFHIHVSGRHHLPHNRNVLIAANHASHLDMGLIKIALGNYGDRVRALAAQDYFFRPGIRRFFFSNFTNLIAIDRSADLRESLRPGLTALQRGEIVLMFPEGTRTTTGTMGRFKRGVGYLALAAGQDVLPVHIHGTFDAIPKGQILLPKRLRLHVTIGPAITHANIVAATQQLAPDHAYREAAHYIEERVRALVAKQPTDVAEDGARAVER